MWHSGLQLTDRCSMLTETAGYIHTLRNQLEELAAKKTEMIAQSTGLWRKTTAFASTKGFYGSCCDDSVSSIVEEDTFSHDDRTSVEPTDVSRPVDDDTVDDLAVRFFGGDAFITLKSLKGRSIWSGLLQILHEKDVEVTNVALSTSRETAFHCIHAKVPSSSELRSHHLHRLLKKFVVAEPRIFGYPSD